MEKKNLNVKEAAAWSGMSEAWFNRKRWTGDGPVYLKSDDGRGGRILYPLTELERFFSGRLRRSTSDPGPAVKALPEGKQAAKIRRIGKGKQAPSAGLALSQGQGGAENV